MHTTTTNAPFLVLNIFLLWLGLCTLRTLPALSAAASQIFCALAAKEGRVRSYIIDKVLSEKSDSAAVGNARRRRHVWLPKKSTATSPLTRTPITLGAPSCGGSTSSTVPPSVTAVAELQAQTKLQDERLKAIEAAYQARVVARRARELEELRIQREEDAYYASLKKPVITLDMPWPEYMVAIGLRSTSGAVSPPSTASAGGAEMRVTVKPALTATPITPFDELRCPLTNRRLSELRKIRIDRDAAKARREQNELGAQKRADWEAYSAAFDEQSRLQAERALHKVDRREWQRATKAHVAKLDLVVSMAAAARASTPRTTTLAVHVPSEARASVQANESPAATRPPAVARPPSPPASIRGLSCIVIKPLASAPLPVAPTSTPLVAAQAPSPSVPPAPSSSSSHPPSPFSIPHRVPSPTSPSSLFRRISRSPSASGSTPRVRLAMRAAPVRVIAPAPSLTTSTLSKMQSEKEAQRTRDRAAAIKKGSDWTGSRHCTARTEDELELLEAIEAEDARLQQIENVEVDAFQCWLLTLTRKQLVWIADNQVEAQNNVRSARAAAKAAASQVTPVSPPVASGSVVLSASPTMCTTNACGNSVISNYSKTLINTIITASPTPPATTTRIHHQTAHTTFLPSPSATVTPIPTAALGLSNATDTVMSDQPSTTPNSVNAPRHQHPRLNITKDDTATSDPVSTTTNPANTPHHQTRFNFNQPVFTFGSQPPTTPRAPTVDTAMHDAPKATPMARAREKFTSNISPPAPRKAPLASTSAAPAGPARVIAGRPSTLGLQSTSARAPIASTSATLAQPPKTTVRLQTPLKSSTVAPPPKPAQASKLSTFPMQAPADALDQILGTQTRVWPRRASSTPAPQPATTLTSIQVTKSAVTSPPPVVQTLSANSRRLLQPPSTSTLTTNKLPYAPMATPIFPSRTPFSAKGKGKMSDEDAFAAAICDEVEQVMVKQGKRKRKH